MGSLESRCALEQKEHNMHETFDRHDVVKKAHEIITGAEPPVVCEVCGTILPHLSNGINFWFNVGIGVPGSPQISAFGCDSGQHWTCSIKCLKLAGPECFLKHIVPTIEQANELLEQTKENYTKRIQELLEVKNDVNSSNNVLGAVSESG
jgi:hypothetical protein